MSLTTAEDWAAKSRRLETITLDKAEVRETVVVCHAVKSWSFQLPIEQLTRIPQVGREYQLETVNLSQTTGLRDDAGWLMRKSDQQLADEHNRMVREFDEKRRETLAANREQWAELEAALPDWLRDRLARFRINGGEQFELDGWGYELLICRLAEMYTETGGEDTDAIWAFANQYGTSGNQHDCAKALAAAHQAGEDLARFPAGFTPITGDPFYLKAGARG
ncbi:hypothetical protein [Prescottella equi]|uniref:hypothetical protein n=1 Tax=Rhodococcus hoagii TaxID=43767 RepID=UPI001EEB0811|nr:hypothetical protein [Prescottella equi]